MTSNFETSREGFCKFGWFQSVIQLQGLFSLTAF